MKTPRSFLFITILLPILALLVALMIVEGVPNISWDMFSTPSVKEDIPKINTDAPKIADNSSSALQSAKNLSQGVK